MNSSGFGCKCLTSYWFSQYKHGHEVRLQSALRSHLCGLSRSETHHKEFRAVVRACCGRESPRCAVQHCSAFGHRSEGAWLLPYSVCFAARELWGKQAGSFRVRSTLSEYVSLPLRWQNSWDAQRDKLSSASVGRTKKLRLRRFGLHFGCRKASHYAFLTSLNLHANVESVIISNLHQQFVTARIKLGSSPAWNERRGAILSRRRASILSIAMWRCLRRS